MLFQYPLNAYIKLIMCNANFTYSLSKLSEHRRCILRFSDFWVCSKSWGTGEVFEYCGVLEGAIAEALVSNWSDDKDVSPKGCWKQEIHIYVHISLNRN